MTRSGNVHGDGSADKVDELVRKLRAAATEREQSVLSQKSYADEPILFTGSELRKRRAGQTASSSKERTAMHGSSDARRSFSAYSAVSEHHEGPQMNRSPHPTEPMSQKTSSTVIFEVPNAETPREARKSSSTHPYTPGIRRDERFAQPHRPVPSQEPLANRKPLPPTLQKLRDMEHPAGIDRFRDREAELFVKQARLAADFEDDAPYVGIVPHHRRATYENLDDAELRGYFTWRAQWRHGAVNRMPNAYARILAAEIVNGIGVDPGCAAFDELNRLRKRALELDASGTGPDIDVLAERWIRDYAIVHRIDSPSLVTKNEQVFASAVAAVRHAEIEVLETGNPVADADALWSAVQRLSGKSAEKSPFLRTHPAEAAEVFALVFKRLVDYCALHSTLSYTDGIVGRKTSRFWAPFMGLPYLPEGAEDQVVPITAAEYARREGGRWRIHRWYSNAKPNKQLAQLIRSIDRAMRIDWGFGHPLKEQPLPAFMKQVVSESSHAVHDRLVEAVAEAEREKRRITFDFSKLGTIRSDAAVTRDALLVDEEVDDAPAPAPAEDGLGRSKQNAAPSGPAGGITSESPLSGAEAAAERSAGRFKAKAASETQTAPNDKTEPVKITAVECEEPAGRGENPPAPTERQADAYGLTSDELAIAARILDGRSFVDLLQPGEMAAVVVDRINEKLFDEFGDAVFEVCDGAPCPVEDYADDVRDLLGLSTAQ